MYVEQEAVEWEEYEPTPVAFQHAKKWWEVVDLPRTYMASCNSQLLRMELVSSLAIPVSGTMHYKITGSLYPLGLNPAFPSLSHSR